MVSAAADHNLFETCWYTDHPPTSSDPQTIVAIIPRVHLLESWGDKVASVTLYPHSRVAVVNGILYKIPRCSLPARFVSDAQWAQALVETTDVYVGWTYHRNIKMSIEPSDGMFHTPCEMYQVYALFESKVITMQRRARRRIELRKLFKVFSHLSHVRLGGQQLKCIQRACGVEDIMRNIYEHLIT